MSTGLKEPHEASQDGGRVSAGSCSPLPLPAPGPPPPHRAPSGPGDVLLLPSRCRPADQLPALSMHRRCTAFLGSSHFEER